MRKIFLVIQREYLTRVRKKSFWILTLLIPILIALLYAIPIYFSVNAIETSKIVVVDETGLYSHFSSDDEVVYEYSTDTTADALENELSRMREDDEIDAVVYIQQPLSGVVPTEAFVYYAEDSPNAMVQSNVDDQMQNMLRNDILLDVYNIPKEAYDELTNTSVKLHTQDIETGKSDFVEIKMVLSILLGLLIYMVIFIFGSQVMQGVKEEKTNRIVEVIISSLKPFQLMKGKVIGIALIGLTQFALWILLSAGALTAISAGNADMFEQAKVQEIQQVASKGEAATSQAMQEAVEYSETDELLQGLMSINYGTIILMFLIFFVLGYFMYATLFAAVGALNDTDTDNNQFVLPLTAPLILVMVLSPTIMEAPSSDLAVWLSIIPFTSPVAMMMRIPFGVPIPEVIISVVLLLLTFVLCTWVAAKIYRTGILLYGKKITYKEIWKWLKFKN